MTYETISHARAIRRYGVANSRWNLVHIKQFHFSQDLPPSQYPLVIDCQRDIESILIQLYKKNSSLDIFLEGFEEVLTPKQANQFKQNVQEPLLFGGAITFCAKKRISLYPTACKDLESCSDTQIHHPDECERRRKLFALESIARRQPTTDPILIYGGIHSFGGVRSCGYAFTDPLLQSHHDALYEWNETHPDQKFSLVEITPQHFLELRQAS
ncbi:MAG: hypothetical protein ACMXYF_03200 [Candidatus Woesearchaeota archaeon]